MPSYLLYQAVPVRVKGVPTQANLGGIRTRRVGHLGDGGANDAGERHAALAEFEAQALEDDCSSGTAATHHETLKAGRRTLNKNRLRDRY